jgi:hypothetical protein
MRLAGTVTLRLFAARAVAGLLMLLFLLAMIASHSVPLSSALEIPLGIAGWLAIPVVLVILNWGGTGTGELAPPRRGWRWVLPLAFAAAAGLAVYLAFTGNLSLACPQDATSCLKTDNWKMSGGRYYRQFPYDSQGNDDPGAQWAEISRPVYIAEVGTRLRDSAQAGIAPLILACLLTDGLHAPRRDPAPPRPARSP